MKKGEIILKYTAPDVDWESTTEEQKETLKEIGWEIEDGLLVQYRSVPEEIKNATNKGYLLPYEEVENNHIEHGVNIYEDEDLEEDILIINGKETEIKDGYFEVEGNPETIEVEIDENTKQTVQKDKDGKYRVILEQNLTQMIEEMDDHAEHAGSMVQPMNYGKTYKPGDWVHCNRFNGPYTDDRHLKKTHPQAIINFYHSDCDYGALRYCKSHKNCNQKYRAAYCSYKQGHSTKYHRH